VGQLISVAGLFITAGGCALLFAGLFVQSTIDESDPLREAFNVVTVVALPSLICLGFLLAVLGWLLSKDDQGSRKDTLIVAMLCLPPAAMATFWAWLISTL